MPEPGSTPDAPANEPGVPEFEAALEEIEGILAALEREELRLDEALALFETGVARLRVANRFLERAKGTVEELIAEASGELRTAPFEAPEDVEPDR